jgi:hypothetical protein
MSGVIITVPEILFYTIAVVPPGILDPFKFQWGRVTFVLSLENELKKLTIVKIISYYKKYIFKRITLIDCRQSAEICVRAAICLDDASYEIDLV